MASVASVTHETCAARCRACTDRSEILAKSARAEFEAARHEKVSAWVTQGTLLRVQR